MQLEIKNKNKAKGKRQTLPTIEVGHRDGTSRLKATKAKNKMSLKLDYKK